MKLVILNVGPDTGGCGIALKQAFDNYTDWETRAVCREETYLGYPTDIVWPYEQRMTDEVWGLVKEADVVHVMDSERALLPFRRLLRGKTVVVHHLGTHFRRNARRIYAQCKAWRVIQVTDSVDLTRSDISFLPATTDLEAMADIREQVYRASQRIRIAHAPTNREVKSTDTIMGAVKSLASRYPIDFDLIERAERQDALKRKAASDIFVDQLKLGFGVNNIECWAMRMPVVSGWQDDEPRRKCLEMWGYLPWADANPSNVAEVIGDLVENPDHRDELGQLGWEHAQRWHSQESVVKQTLAVYGR